MLIEASRVQLNAALLLCLPWPPTIEMTIQGLVRAATPGAKVQGVGFAVGRTSAVFH